MKINLAIPLDKKGIKLVNHFRFLYRNRVLIKEYAGYIFLFKSAKDFVNTKLLKARLKETIGSQRRFLVELSGIKTLMPSEFMLYFGIKENRHIENLISLLSLFIPIDRGERLPMIPLYRGVDREDTSNMYKEIMSENVSIKHSFFAQEIHLLMKGRENYWECVESYRL